MVQGQEAWAAELKPEATKTLQTLQSLLAILLGLIQALAMTYPINGAVTAALQVAGFSAFICFIGRVENTYLNSWLFATSWLLGSVAWLYIALHVHGHMPPALSIITMLMLCGGLAIYYSTAIWASMALRNRSQPLQGVMLIAVAWTTAEMARAQWFTGFPWAAIGYAQINSYLSYLAAWVGVYGVGFASVLLAGVMAMLWEKKKVKHRLLVIAVVLLLLLQAERPVSEGQNQLQFTLLQANISQDSKFSSGRADALHWYKEEIMKSKADITVLPETAIPYFQSDLPAEYWQSIEHKYANKQQAAIIGIPTRNTQNEYGNSAVALGMTAGPSQYDKYHLVPFGEFTPDGLKWFTQVVDFGMTDFIRGSQQPAPMVWNGHKLAVNICYEDLFGEELAKRFVLEQDKVPDVLVNISNIGWFGNNYVVDQHLNIARMRSLEFNRPTVRATNSGGTAIISAQGRVLSALQPYTRGVLTGEVATGAKEITPYAYWAGHWGLKPLWLFCAAIWVIAFWSYKKKREAQNRECAQ